MPITKPSSPSERKTRTVVDTIRIIPESIQQWLSPPFQRPVRENDKVRALAEQLKLDGGVLPGIITLGVLDGKTYLIDGQHRRAAFLISGLEEGYTDVRTHFFRDMADMGEEFVLLNSSLVRLRPDDILRGLEGTLPLLGKIREKCPFVGYDMIRRGNNAPILSMSTLIRVWRASEQEVPAAATGSSAMVLAGMLTEESANNMIEFLNIAHKSFGRDPEYQRLWGALNLTLCAWLYHTTVLKKHTICDQINRDMFQKCMMSLSTVGTYLDWLVGRNLSERDRSPAYSKIKVAFAKRIFTETGRKPKLPAPPWHHGAAGIKWNEE